MIGFVVSGLAAFVAIMVIADHDRPGLRTWAIRTLSGVTIAIALWWIVTDVLLFVCRLASPSEQESHGMDIRTHKIAAIPGDGIGVEVVAAGLEVLDALAERDGSFRFEVERFDWSTDRYKKIGAFMPADGARQQL